MDDWYNQPSKGYMSMLSPGTRARVQDFVDDGPENAMFTELAILRDYAAHWAWQYSYYRDAYMRDVNNLQVKTMMELCGDRLLEMVEKLAKVTKTAAEVRNLMNNVVSREEMIAMSVRIVGALEQNTGTVDGLTDRFKTILNHRLRIEEEQRIEGVANAPHEVVNNMDASVPFVQPQDAPQQELKDEQENIDANDLGFDLPVNGVPGEQYTYPGGR